MTIMMLAMIIYETTVVGGVGRTDIGRSRQTAEVVEKCFAAREDNYMAWLVRCTEYKTCLAMPFAGFVVNRQAEKRLA
jgi:hypothetical protein